MFVVGFSTKTSYKTNSKMNNTISYKTEHLNKYDKEGIYKLTCRHCNKFYIERINRNFNMRFKEHKKDSIYVKGKSKFSDHTFKEGLKIKEIQETMTIRNLENENRKINILEEIEILKVASSQNVLNDVINGRSDPVHRPSVSA